MLVFCIVWTVKSRTAPLYSARASPLLHGDMSRAHRAHSLWIKPNYSKSTASVHRNPHTVTVSTNLLTTPHYNATNTFALTNLTVGLYTKKANWLQQMSNIRASSSMFSGYLMSEWNGRFYETKLPLSNISYLFKTFPISTCVIFFQVQSCVSYFTAHAGATQQNEPLLTYICLSEQVRLTLLLY